MRSACLEAKTVSDLNVAGTMILAKQRRDDFVDSRGDLQNMSDDLKFRLTGQMMCARILTT